jgi:hypothetical protein
MDPRMTDLEQLTVLDPSRGREPSASEWARSQALVDRMTSGRRSRPMRRTLVVVAAAAVVGVVGAVTLPSLLQSTAERAYASWTPAPGSLTGEQVLPQARTCAGNGVGEADGAGGQRVVADPADVLLAEQRGLATLLIMRKSNGVIVECMSTGPGQDDQLASMSLADRKPPAPPAGTVSLETMSSSGEGDTQWSNIVGLVGPGVTAVEVRLDGGRVFQASVRNGWWAAWWPGPEGGEVDTLTVTVHTAAGGATSLRPSQLA